MSTAAWRRWSTRTGGTTRPDVCCSRSCAAEVASGGRFLDVGAGTGATGAWLAEHGSLVASDFMPLALELNRERHEVPGQTLDLVAADVTKLPFATGSFDLCLCVTVLCHQSIVDPAEAVRELARVVRPGGVVCLWEPGVRRLRRAHDRVTHSARRFSRRDLSELLRPGRAHARAIIGGLLVPRPARRREGGARTR